MKNIKAKKRYGQNFLKDENILSKIIESMPNNSNHLVEIGPGLGDLTQKLVKYKEMTAYEVDSDLFTILKSKFATQIENNRLKLIHTDVLESWDKQDTLFDCKYDLIANLPYYIATNIILRAFEDDNCEHIIVMIQKEVALKFAASEGDKEFSALGVMAKLISKESRILFDVPPTSFEPAPKVMSSILYIRKNRDVELSPEFKKFLKAAFMQPRKKLSKNLSSYIDKKTLAIIYEELDLSDNIRPHELSASLYRQMHKKVILNDRERRKQEQ
ncbi:MAG: 16S rRNA (adenine(1518)-N(6)/adenine(1519)-N(6))-dimethyltransferase RsmA [Campylobacteraceae bacterium]|nr:16S rRNA (adenine(1518)-N(6)/adenine(1519)-N(6))-dimethyltransferase RsmA [Campylobacteraceae bacterium]